MTARPCIPPPPGCRETPLPMADVGEMARWREGADAEEERCSSSTP